MRLSSLAGVIVVIICCAGCAVTARAGNATANQTGRAAPGATAATTIGPKPTGAGQSPPPSKPTGPDVQRRLSAAVAGVIKADGGHAAVAVDDLSTGQEAAYDGSGEFATASIVKVDILSTLLYQLGKSGETLSGEQRELATMMIENSDNDAASALYDDDGEAAGVDAANKAFGLTGTTAGSDGEWGLTSTTVTDQIKILRQVFTGDSVLPPAGRDYIQGLMRDVEPDQRWGVPAAAARGSTCMVKNGWLPNPSLWEINSIGEITRDGQKLLVAVLSADNETEDGGISLVQEIARNAAAALTG